MYEQIVFFPGALFWTSNVLLFAQPLLGLRGQRFCVPAGCLRPACVFQPGASGKQILYMFVGKCIHSGIPNDFLMKVDNLGNQKPLIFITWATYFAGPRPEPQIFARTVASQRISPSPDALGGERFQSEIPWGESGYRISHLGSKMAPQIAQVAPQGMHFDVQVLAFLAEL